MESPRECWVHDTFTGERIQRLYPSGGTWTARVAGVDAVSYTHLTLPTKA